MPFLRSLLLVALAMLALAGGRAEASSRHALVVGIDDYASVPVLQKARNDARAVAAALEGAGFRTDLVLDADENALLAALAVFAGRLDRGDEAVSFFAGHGVEIEGRNYLLPADVPAVPPGQELIITRRALPVDDVIDTFRRRGVRLSLLILDACRDNPFEQVGGRSVGGARGLARVSAPEGTFVLYSAGAGEAALDRLSNADPDPNSVFTRALLPRLSMPGLELRQITREVRSEVRQLARTIGHDQFPAFYDQLDREFQFIPAAMGAAPAAEPLRAPVQATGTDPCAAARSDWLLLGESPGAAVLEAFRATHAGCPIMMALAEDRLAALSPPPAAEPTREPDWTGATSITLSGHMGSVTSAAFSPDGSRIVTAFLDDTARVWDAATGREIHTLSGHWNWVLSAAFSPDGGRIVTVSQDHTARVWDAATGRVITTLGGYANWVRSALLSPDGSRIVTSSLDNTARVWDAATEREIVTLSGHTNVLLSAAFSPDGSRIVTASADNTARVWDAATGRVIHTLGEHTGYVRSAAFSPDGGRIVTASFDNTARVWDAATGRVIATLSGHTDRVNSAAFSPDGGRIVTASSDHTARIWTAR